VRWVVGRLPREGCRAVPGAVHHPSATQIIGDMHMDIQAMPMQLVYVEWDDAAELRTDATWFTRDELEGQSADVPCYSVGWVVERTDTHMLLVSLLSPTGDGDAMMGLPFKIPTPMVRKVTVICQPG